MLIDFGARGFVDTSTRRARVQVTGSHIMSMSRIYVGRLSYQVREKDVERFFRGFGRIKDINLKNGFGFVVSLAV